MNGRRARALRREHALTAAPAVDDTAVLVERCEHGLVACRLCGTLAAQRDIRPVPNRAALRAAGRYASKGRSKRHRASTR